MKMPSSERGMNGTAALLYGIIVLIFLNFKLFPAAGFALGNHDTRGLFVPWLTFAREAIWNGRLPLWDAFQFAGNPFLSNPQIALFYPPTWLAIFLPVNTGLSWHIALHLFLGALGMYLFVRQVSGGWAGPFITGLIYAFSSFALARIWAGHIGLLATNAWLPWILLTATWSVQRGSLWAGIISGVPWAMAILAGHTSSLFYIGLVWLLFLIYLAISENGWLLVARQGALAFLMGILLSGVQLLPFLQLSQHVVRSAANSFEFATAFSLPVQQLATLAVPDFFGDPVNGYWGEPYFEELTFYTGVLALLGFLLFFRRPSALQWFYIVVAFTGILLALGNNTQFYQVLYDFFPPIRLLRGPGRAGILFVFTSAALLGEAISRGRPVGDEAGAGRARLMMRLLTTLVIVLGIGTAVYLGGQIAGAESAEKIGQLQTQVNGILRATLIAGIGLPLIWWLAGSPKITVLALGALSLLILFDLWGFGYQLVKPEPFGPHPMWSDAQQIIGEDAARVLPWGVHIFEQNGAGQVGMKSVFGYNTLEPEATISLAASQPDPRSQAYDVLAIDYVLSSVKQEGYEDGLTLIGQTDNVWVYQRDRQFDQVRLVSQFEVIEEPDRALQRINQPGFDPLSTVILDHRPDCEPEEGDGTAEIIEQDHGYWQIETASDAASLLLVSETAYPGWNVEIDGRPAEPLLAYTALRAVCVPPGQHTVTWRFQPSIFIWGAGLSLIGLIFLSVAVIKER